MRERPTVRRRAGAALLLFAVLAWASPSYALDNVTISTFQGSFVALPLYVAKAYKLFEKNGAHVELLYGTGIQPTNILVGGSANFGAFAIEHGINLIGKGQGLKLLVVCQGATPYGLIVRNNVPTPNLHKPYPEMLKDMKGLKLGVSSIGAGTDTMLRYLLHQAGIAPSEVQILPVGGPGAQVAGIKNGAIDGALSF
jgi:NitT/TauT family transport system substrate-binding protein